MGAIIMGIIMGATGIIGAELVAGMTPGGVCADCLSLRDASLDGRQSGLRRERSPRRGGRGEFAMKLTIFSVIPANAGTQRLCLCF